MEVGILLWAEMVLQIKQNWGGGRDRGHGGPDKPNREKPGSCKASEEPRCHGRCHSCPGSGSPPGPLHLLCSSAAPGIN